MYNVDCACTVSKLVSETTTWENVYPCVVNSDKRSAFDAVMPPELLEDLVTFVATSAAMNGEMLESSSPADILFWVIHLGVDRMLAAKRLPGVSVMGDTDFVKWGVVDGSNESWLDWSYYTFNEGENAAFPEGYHCVGHAADDPVLPPHVPLTDAVLAIADANNDGIVSNWEFYMAIDPNNVDGLDYVYDDFNWDHCIGVDV